MKNHLSRLTSYESFVVGGGIRCIGQVTNGYSVTSQTPYHATSQSECESLACIPNNGNTEYIWGNEIHDCNNVAMQKSKKIIRFDQPTPLGSRFASVRSNWQ